MIVKSRIADTLPSSSTTVGAIERLRQAFVGYDDLPQDTERQPLRVYVHDDGENIRLCVNEFQTLVNRIPMATVCSEARSHAVKFCHKQIDIVDLHYSADPSNTGDEILDHIFQPMTVMITNANRLEEGPPGFTSADQYVEYRYNTRRTQLTLGLRY